MLFGFRSFSTQFVGTASAISTKAFATGTCTDRTVAIIVNVNIKYDNNLLKIKLIHHNT